MKSDTEQNMNKLDLSVLVVEDMIVNQKLIKLMLEDLGCSVTLASNGKQAIDLYKETTINAFNIFGKVNFDIILMDQVMPVMDGRTALKKLSECHQTLPPVIALTADESFLIENTYIETGFADCMIKPVSPGMLYEKLTYWAGRDNANNTHENDDIILFQEIESKPHINKRTFNLILKNARENNFDLALLLDSFVNDMEKIKLETLIAVKTEDYDVLEEITLTVKGMSGNMGASQLLLTAGLLNKFIKEKKFDQLMNVIILLFEKFNSFRNEFKKEYVNHVY